jgi:hypothetical protein
VESKRESNKTHSPSLSASANLFKILAKNAACLLRSEHLLYVHANLPRQVTQFLLMRHVVIRPTGWSVRGLIREAGERPKAHRELASGAEATFFSTQTKTVTVFDSCCTPRNICCTYMLICPVR